MGQNHVHLRGEMKTKPVLVFFRDFNPAVRLVLTTYRVVVKDSKLVREATYHQVLVTDPETCKKVREIRLGTEVAVTGKLTSHSLRAAKERHYTTCYLIEATGYVIERKATAA